jgi:SAM-dependent methyltransferase
MNKASANTVTRSYAGPAARDEPHPNDDGLALWRQAFSLHGSESLPASAAAELASYLGLAVAESQDRLQRAKDDFVREWELAGVDPHDSVGAVAFYRHSKAELFEIMHGHALKPQYAGGRYTLALAACRQLRPTAQTYLDFGAGVGTGALLFKQAGFRVTLADVSTALLDFSQWRFHIRGLDAAFLDLETVALPSDAFDMVTCFDVLEHVPDPLVTLLRIRQSLKPGGLLALRISYAQDHDHPMHIAHDPLLPFSLESLGFSYHLGVVPPTIQLLTRVDSPGRTATSSPALALGARLTGHAAFTQGDITTARKYFRLALRHYPFDARALCYFGLTCLPPSLVEHIRTIRHRIRHES